MMNKKTSSIAFRMICILFSTVLALMTLRCGVELTVQSERIDRLQQEEKTLLEENERLRVRLSCSIDLEELEKYAVQVLGMQPCQGGQVHVIHSVG